MTQYYIVPDWMHLVGGIEDETQYAHDQDDDLYGRSEPHDHWTIVTVSDSCIDFDMGYHSTEEAIAFILKGDNLKPIIHIQES